MTSVAFIVDGDLEKKFLSASCKGSHIRKIGNGDKCPAHVIAKQSLTQINLLSNRVQEFVILLDLEKRNQECDEFANEIMHELKAAGLGNQNVRIFIKEREIEDWILADNQAVSEFVGVEVDTAQLKGKGGLSSLLKNYGIKYSEITTGVPLLKAVICSRAAQKSDSLNNFRSNFPAKCWWIDR